MTKRAVYQSSRTDLRTALDLISSHVGIVSTTEDHKKALNNTMENFKKVSPTLKKPGANRVITMADFDKGR